jgi:hypothetical protein
MTFLKKIYGTFCDFHKSPEKLKKNLYPSNPWNELKAPRTLQIIENGPQLKKSGHPWYRASLALFAHTQPNTLLW